MFNSPKAKQILINKNIHFSYLKIAVCITIMKQIIRKLSKVADHMHQLFRIHWHRMFQINFIHQYLNGWQRPKRLEVCSIQEVTWVLENNRVHFILRKTVTDVQCPHTSLRPIHFAMVSNQSRNDDFLWDSLTITRYKCLLYIFKYVLHFKKCIFTVKLLLTI